MMQIASNASLRASVNRVSVSRPLPCAVSNTSARHIVLRATPDDSRSGTGPTTSVGTTSTGSQDFPDLTETEYKAAVASGAIMEVPGLPGLTPPANPSAMPDLGKIMSFDGSGPEIINGRLAMLGFIAAVGAELSSGDSIIRQLSEEPTGIIAVFVLFMAGSLVPFLNGSKRTESIGPFSPNAEMINGRAAMIGFAAMLVIEKVSGQALL